MSLDKRIRMYLGEAESSYSESALQSAYHLLRENGKTTAATVTPAFSSDNYVLCAEAAIKLEKYDLAESCLDSYDASAPAKNQFLVRSFYARAQVDAHAVRLWKGQKLRAALLATLETLMQGLRIARADPLYAFLVYNASIVYAQISRPLQVKGFRQYLHPFQSEISASLEELGDTDYEWRIELLIGLAWCLADAGKLADAQKAASDGEVLATKYVPDMRARILSLQIELSKDVPAGLAKAKSSAGNDPYLKVLYHTLAVQVGAVKPESVENELKEAVRAAGFDYAQLLQPSGDSNVIGAKTEGTGKKTGASGKDKGGKDKGGDKGSKDTGAASVDRSDAGDLLGLIGVCAAQHGLDDLGEACARRCITSKSLGARVRSEFTQALLLVGSLGATANKLTRNMVTIRAAALKRMDKALESGARTGDPVLVEDMCFATWNMSLPLLQGTLRKHAARALQRVLQCLDLVKSQQNLLRAQVLLELANCDVADDFLSKAVNRVEAAVRLDYAVPVEESDKMGMSRPLDRFLFPLRDKLSLKTHIHRDAKSRDEQATLLLEQAREAKDPQLAATFLQNAADALDADPLAVDEDDEAQQRLLKENDDIPDAVLEPQRNRCRLWIDVAQQAWKYRLRQLTRRAATSSLAHIYTDPADKDLTVQQALVYFIEAESCVAELQANDDALHIVDDLDKRVAIDSVVPGMPNATDGPTLKARALRGFLEGMVLGLNLKEPWIVLNGAIYIWNYLQPAIASNTAQPFLNILGKTYEALSQLDTPDIPLLCSVVDALCQAMLREVENPSEVSQGTDGNKNEHDGSGGKKSKKGDSKPSAAVTASKSKGGRGGKGAGNPEESSEPVTLNWQCPADGTSILKLGIECCDFAIERARPMQKKTVLRTKAQLERALKQTPQAKGDAESQVIVLLEALGNDATPDNTKHSTLQTAIATLADAKRNPELWTRLAFHALELSSHDLCRQCHERAVPDKVTITSSADLYKPVVWRWFSLVCMLYGRSLLSQLVPEKQEKLYQNQLQWSAMVQFQLASRCGRHANRQDLVTAASGRFWNVCSEFLSSSLSREGLRPMIQTVIDDLTHWPVDPEVPTAGYLFKALMECITDDGDMQGGIAAFDHASATLPSTMMTPLWEYRVVFLSRAGKNVIADMFKMKESSTKQVQATVWMTLARNAKTTLQQLSAYQSGVDTLDSQPGLQVDILIEYALWLYTNGFPVRDARDALYTAIDHLQVIDENANEIQQDVPQSVASRRSRRTGAGSVRSRLSRPTQASTRPMSGKSSTHASAIESSTGSARMREQAAFASRMETRHCVMFEKLVRLNVLVAHMASDSAEVTQHLLIAYEYVLRLWDHLDIHARNDQLARAEEAFAGKDKNGDANDDDATLPPSLLDCTLPETPEGWVGFTVPEVLQEFATRDTSHNSLNKQSLERPDEFCHFMSTFVRLLKEHGLHMHAVPVIKLQAFVANVVVGSDPYNQLLNLHLGELYEDLGLTKEARQVWDEVGSLTLTPAVRAKYREKLKTRAAELALARSRSTSVDKDNKFGGAGDGISRRREHFLRPVLIRDVWAQQARFAIRAGQLLEAAELLEEAIQYAESFEDPETMTQCLVLKAKVQHQTGNTNAAIELVKQSRRYPVSIDIFVEGTIDLSEYYKSKSLSTLAKEVLDQSVDLLLQHQSDPANSALVVDCARARLLQRRGRLAFEEVSAMLHKNPAAHSVKDIQEGSAAYKQASDLLAARSLVFHRAQATYDLVRFGLVSLNAEPGVRHKELLALHDSVRRINQMLDIYSRETADIDIPRHAQPPLARVQIEGLLLDGIVGYKVAESLYTNPGLMRDPMAMPSFPVASDGNDDVIRQFLVPDAEDVLGEPREGLEKALVSLTTAENLAVAPATQARALLHLGSCLRRLEMTQIGARDPWEPKEESSEPEQAQAVPAGDDPVDQEAQDGQAGDGAETERTSATAVTGATASKDDPVLLYRPHAVQALEKGLALAREHELSDIARSCCIELADCYGLDSPIHTARYIALAQAYGFQDTGRTLICSATHENDPERLFMRRAAFLASQHAYADSCPQLAKDREYLLQSSVAWRRTSVPDSFASIQKEIPDGSDLLVLHWHPESLHMYAAVITNPTDASASRPAQAVRFPIEAIVLPTLQDNCNKMRKALTRHLISSYNEEPAEIESSIPQVDKKGGKDKKSDKKGAKDDKRKGATNTSAQQAEEETEEPVQARTNAITDLLADLLDQADFLLTPVREMLERYNQAHNQSADDEGEDQGERAPSSKRCLVVCTDPITNMIPFEGLPFAQEYQATLRDFSVALFAHRASWADDKGTFAAVSRAKFGYIIDAHNEAMHEDAEDNTLTTAFEREVLKGKNYVKDWVGALGSLQVPSPVDWQRALHQRSGFIYLGHNSLFSQIDPPAVAGLDLSGCNLVLDLGRIVNEQSSRRQSKIDTNKPPTRLEQETSTATCIILSLRGANAVVSNQWSATEQGSFQTLASLLAQLEGGIALQECLNNIFSAEWESYIRFNPTVYGLPHARLAA